MAERLMIIEAVNRSWARETAAVPELWDRRIPSRGHCDVSSFVAWEHLGGELVLGEVHRHGTFQEHHYWNRIDGVDLDLTRDQFRNGETITEREVLSEPFLRANHGRMRPDLRDRIATFRRSVSEHLATG
ncbi:MAG: hypothetical protein AAF531_12110 [Actinomycetota bacterium]